MEWCFGVVQSKDDEKSSQKGGTEMSLAAEDWRGGPADQDEQQSCGGTGSLEVSTNRSERTTSERRVTRASARSQQQRGRSSADGTSANLSWLARDVCCDASVLLSVRLSVHWRIIANLGFKFRSHFTAHCRAPCCSPCCLRADHLAPC